MKRKIAIRALNLFGFFVLPHFLYITSLDPFSWLGTQIIPLLPELEMGILLTGDLIFGQQSSQCTYSEGCNDPWRCRFLEPAGNGCEAVIISACTSLPCSIQAAGAAHFCPVCKCNIFALPSLLPSKCSKHCRTGTSSDQLGLVCSRSPPPTVLTRSDEVDDVLKGRVFSQGHSPCVWAAAV